MGGSKPADQTADTSQPTTVPGQSGGTLSMLASMGTILGAGISASRSPLGPMLLVGSQMLGNVAEGRRQWELVDQFDPGTDEHREAQVLASSRELTPANFQTLQKSFRTNQASNRMPGLLAPVEVKTQLPGQRVAPEVPEAGYSGVEPGKTITEERAPSFSEALRRYHEQAAGNPNLQAAAFERLIQARLPYTSTLPVGAARQAEIEAAVPGLFSSGKFATQEQARDFATAAVNAARGHEALAQAAMPITEAEKKRAAQTAAIESERQAEATIRGEIGDYDLTSPSETSRFLQRYAELGGAPAKGRQLAYTFKGLGRDAQAETAYQDFKDNHLPTVMDRLDSFNQKYLYPGDRAMVDQVVESARRSTPKDLAITKKSVDSVIAQVARAVDRRIHDAQHMEEIDKRITAADKRFNAIATNKNQVQAAAMAGREIAWAQSEINTLNAAMPLETADGRMVLLQKIKALEMQRELLKPYFNQTASQFSQTPGRGAVVPPPYPDVNTSSVESPGNAPTAPPRTGTGTPPRSPEAPKVVPRASESTLKYLR